MIEITIEPAMDMTTKEWRYYYEIEAHGVRVISNKRYKTSSVAFVQARLWCSKHGITLDDSTRYLL